jgi:hypothetical protein
MPSSLVRRHFLRKKKKEKKEEDGLGRINCIVDKSVEKKSKGDDARTPSPVALPWYGKYSARSIELMSFA